MQQLVYKNSNSEPAACLQYYLSEPNHLYRWLSYAHGIRRHIIPVEHRGNDSSYYCKSNDDYCLYSDSNQCTRLQQLVFNDSNSEPAACMQYYSG